MNNCNKIKKTCTDSTFATCVDYEGDLGQNTKITSDCVTLHQTTEDVYSLIDEILENTDLTGIGEDCLIYAGEKTFKKIINRYEQEICTLKDEVKDLKETDLCNRSITECGLELGALVDLCGYIPATLGELLQVILTKLNE